MRSVTRWCAPVLALGLALGLAGCGDDDDEGTVAAGDDAAEEETTTTAGDGAAAVRMVDFAFDPEEVTARPGATISITNEDGTTHTFTSDDAGIDVEVGGGESGEATAPEEAGSYDFLCTIHPSMTGTLVVA